MTSPDPTALAGRLDAPRTAAIELHATEQARLRQYPARPPVATGEQR